MRFVPRHQGQSLTPEQLQRDYPNTPALVARLAHARGISESNLAPGAGRLDHFSHLKDVDLAAKRIVAAIKSGEHILINGDHDSDGTHGIAVIASALRAMGHPPSKLSKIVSHRTREGYGLNAAVLERILALDPFPGLLITTDLGSSDEEQLKVLKAKGCDAVVTDHHEIPTESPPVSAVAFVNPKRPDCGFPDKAIAGCFVAWLTMMATLREAEAQNVVRPGTVKLAGLVDYVTVGTIADAVSLASPNNRAVCQIGLMRIAKGARPCWRSLKDLNPARINSSFLAFQVNPRIAAVGRLDESTPAVDWLLSETDAQAKALLTLMSKANVRRREIEKTMLVAARPLAEKRIQEGKKALVIHLPDGHTGIHGIVASKLVEAFNRPTIMIAPKQGGDSLGGSCRSIEGFHMRDALQAVRDVMGKAKMTSMGGHPMAAGLSLTPEAVTEFEREFERAACDMLGDRKLNPQILTDGEIGVNEITLETCQALTVLEPMGNGCEQPVFETDFKVLSATVMGDGTHVRLLLEKDGVKLDGAWFFCKEPDEPMPVDVSGVYRMAFQLDINQYQDRPARLQLMVKDVQLPAVVPAMRQEHETQAELTSRPKVTRVQEGQLARPDLALSMG